MGVGRELFHRGIRRLRRVSVVLGMVALVLAVTACSNSRERTPAPEETLLRLADVPADATLGDDGACGQGFGFEGAPADLVAWLQEPGNREVTYCLRQLQFRDDRGGWVFVESAVVELGSAEAAEASEGVAEAMLGYRGRRDLEAVASPVDFGGSQLAWRVSGPTAETAGFALSWTTERFRHYLVVAGLPEEAAQRRAAELAARQQERFEHPTLLAAADLDDSQAGLVRAGGAPVYWVGPEWTPAAGAPAELARSDVGIEAGGGPGYSALLDYQVPGQPGGAFSVGTWSNTEWAAMLGGPLGPIAVPGCAPPREVVLADRRIEIHGMGRAPECFSSASAYVFFENVVVSVLFPHCLVCQPRPSQYSTPAYLEEVARGLRRHR